MPAGRLAGGHAALTGHAALGAGGLVHFIFRLFIWRMLWRFSMLIWHIKTFGPVILLLIVLAVAVALIMRARRAGQGSRPGRREDSFGDRGPGEAGPRDW